jgi:hypothetical protein
MQARLVIEASGNKPEQIPINNKKRGDSNKKAVKKQRMMPDEQRKKERRRAAAAILAADDNSMSEPRDSGSNCNMNDNNPDDPFFRGRYTSDNDPHPHILRCRRHAENESFSVLSWPNNPRYTRQQEEALLHVLLKYKKKENNMLCRHPPGRVNEIRRYCAAQQVPLEVACSLRRQHIQWNSPGRTLSMMCLGSETRVRESAAFFEQALEDYLQQQQQVPYYSEEEQKQNNQEKFAPTPDVLFHRPVKLRTNSTNNSPFPSDFLIHWMDAKMYYGASSLPWDDSRSAVGCLLKTAQKYVGLLGPGALVFMYGCGEELAERLNKIGVMALDGSTGLLDLRRVRAHQRKWCANDKGEILP